MRPIYLQKSLVAASSAGIASISSGQSSAASLNSSRLDTGRRILIWASSNGVTSASFTITGTREGGGVISETITGPSSQTGTTPNAVTTQDFLSVTAVSASSALQSQAVVGTNTQGGTPWQSVNTYISPTQISAQLIFSTTANSMVASLELTLDDPFATSPVAPGGLSASYNAVPAVFTSTAFSSVGGNTWDSLNIFSAVGIQTPITAWRMTLTSSSSTAGYVNCTALQSGMGD